MGVATDLMEKIMRNEEYYKEWGLHIPKKERKWCKFNLLVGENGSGKSRMLQMMKKYAQKDCIVIHLDFAAYFQKSYHSEEMQLTSDETAAPKMEVDELIDLLVFREEGDPNIFLDFLRHLDDNLLGLFHELFDMENGGDKHVIKRIQGILNELSQPIEDILHRQLAVRSEGIFLEKADRSVEITEEWEYLSPGERNILVVILAVIILKLIQRPCILLIDELETHLHPDAQVKLYRLVKNVLEGPNFDFCLCIASHSIFLLPLFDIRELVYMNHGRIEGLNGGLYQQIYDNLTGEGDGRGENLTDFMHSMSAWQYAEYLAECFVEPQPVDEIKGDDEQALQFVEVLKGLEEHKKTIYALDFGAGTARIGRCIELMPRENLKSLEGRFRYNIYDKYMVSDRFQENTGWRGKAYRSEDEVRAGGIRFDILLLYNVLHEIGIDEWVKELGFMLDLLTEGGILLFGERKILTLGEKPYGKSGYLVLGREELSILFPRSEIKEILLPNPQKQVTWCFAIEKPKSEEGYPNAKSVKSALQSLKERTRSIIRNRDGNGLGERGKSRKYAFYCQQYINVEEALEMIKEAEKPKMVTYVEPGSSIRTGTNTALADIISSSLTQKNKLRRIRELALTDTEEGRKAKRYLQENKEE